MSKKVNDRLFAFSGRMFSGKDFVAKYAKLNVLGFADPIYELCDYFNGTRDKTEPGIRAWMQRVGQWGWGCSSEEYPATTDRSLFVDHIRRLGRTMTNGYKWVDWSDYGRRKDFWVNILLQKTGLSGNRPRTSQIDLFSGKSEDSGFEIAVTNARFKHELQPLTEAGFCHYHVLCSDDTRNERMKRAGYVSKKTEDVDISERMAYSLDTMMPESLTIWNDHRPAPDNTNYLTIDEFAALSYVQSVAQSRGKDIAPGRQPFDLMAFA